MEDNEVHIGSVEPESGWRRLLRRSVLIPLVAVFMLVVGGWVVFSLSKKQAQKETAVESAIKAADSAFTSGDYQKSLNELKDATNQATSKEEKIQLYSSMAAAAASSGKMSEALEYMEKKHELDPESAKRDAYLLGTYYERIGDNAEAVEHYKTALEYLNSQPKSEVNDNKIESLEVRIQSLGG